MDLISELISNVQASERITHSSQFKFEMNTGDISFHGKDPGAVKFGNFINYYSFHSAKERIEHLHRDMFTNPLENEPYVCLDIGCNSGELTQELYIYLNRMFPPNEIHILGIDIDPTLIKRAKEQNSNSNISFLNLNISNVSEQQLLQIYLKKHEKIRFNVTFCFSVTMWIHINNGDEGLMQFLDYLSKISIAIVLEPQPWHCYRNAQRRLKKAGDTFPHYEKLQIRSNVDQVIEDVIIKHLYKKVYESVHSNWKRKIISFHNLSSI